MRGTLLPSSGSHLGCSIRVDPIADNAPRALDCPEKQMTSPLLGPTLTWACKILTWVIHTYLRVPLTYQGCIDS